jgi:hypothetical protein
MGVPDPSWGREKSFAGCPIAAREADVWTFDYLTVYTVFWWRGWRGAWG